MGLFKTNLKEETLLIEGIKCEKCIERIQSELKKYNVKIKITLNEKLAKISYDENKISLLEIKEKINDLGYTCV